jgi:hypothetical protein
MNDTESLKPRAKTVPEPAATSATPSLRPRTGMAASCVHSASKKSWKTTTPCHEEIGNPFQAGA